MIPWLALLDSTQLALDRSCANPLLAHSGSVRLLLLMVARSVMDLVEHKQAASYVANG